MFIKEFRLVSAMHCNGPLPQVKLKGHNNIATRPQRSATAAAKAILQQLQISDSEKEGSTDFEDLDSDDGSNGDETETMNDCDDCDDCDEDGAISEPEGTGSDLSLAMGPT